MARLDITLRAGRAQATVLGWSGWIVPLALVVVLVATGQFAPGKHRCAVS